VISRSCDRVEVNLSEKFKIESIALEIS
jgi:hypothetical protein